MSVFWVKLVVLVLKVFVKSVIEHEMSMTNVKDKLDDDSN